jgi:release factor glutamine methyltransferase
VTTLAAAVDAAAAQLRAAGFTPEDADIDSGVIARHLLGWSRADWITRRDEPATPAFTEAFARLIHRRAQREPVAYLLGVKEFYGRDFRVRPGVLIPRPETELVVEVALDVLDEQPDAAVLDIGAGSGCIAITIALEAPEARVTATDISPAALDIARENAEALSARVELVEANLLPPSGGPWDLIVSNPPYVPEVDRPALSSDVVDYEPGDALFGGADGLDVIRRLIPAATRRLAADGTLILEVGAGQWQAVTALLERAQYGRIDWHLDLQGIPRVVAARKS